MRWCTRALLCGGLLYGACDEGSGKGSALPLDDSGTASDADGAVSTDAGAFMLDCELVPQPFDQVVEAAGPLGFALDVNVNTGRLMYTVGTCPGPTGLARGRGLRLLTLPSGGELPAPVSLAVEGEDECSLSRDPALASLGSGRALGYFVRPEVDGDQLFVLELVDSQPVRLSPSAGQLSVASAAGGIESTVMVAWVTRAPDQLTTDLTLYRNTSQGSGRTLVASKEGQQIRSLVLGALGRGNRERALGVLAWVNQAQASPAIFMQLLDEKGEPVGRASLLSERVGSASSVSFTGDDDGGALVYTLGRDTDHHELWFQRLDQEGQLDGEPVKLTSGAQEVRAPAIARYARGFAVAYRTQPQDQALSARLRIAFVDRAGNLAGTRDVAEIARGSDSVRMVQARDGRLFVAWIDELPGGTKSLHLVRAVCD